MKHIALRYHFIKDHVEDDNVEIYFTFVRSVLQGIIMMEVESIPKPLSLFKFPVRFWVTCSLSFLFFAKQNITNALFIPFLIFSGHELRQTFAPFRASNFFKANARGLIFLYILYITLVSFYFSLKLSQIQKYFLCLCFPLSNLKYNKYFIYVLFLCFSEIIKIKK